MYKTAIDARLGRNEPVIADLIGPTGLCEVVTLANKSL
jgi:hypothetical protein